MRFVNFGVSYMQPFILLIFFCSKLAILKTEWQWVYWGGYTRHWEFAISLMAWLKSLDLSFAAEAASFAAFCREGHFLRAHPLDIQMPTIGHSMDISFFTRSISLCSLNDSWCSKLKLTAHSKFRPTWDWFFFFNLTALEFSEVIIGLIIIFIIIGVDWIWVRYVVSIWGTLSFVSCWVRIDCYRHAVICHSSRSSLSNKYDTIRLNTFKLVSYGRGLIKKKSISLSRLGS